MEAVIYEKSAWISETRPDVLVAKYKNYLKASGFNFCGEDYKFFYPHGFTAVFLLSESHFAIHTFPEEGKTYIQLSSCIKRYFDEFWRREKAEGDVHVSHG